MDQAGLKKALCSLLPDPLAIDMVDSYLELRRDVASGVLGRSSPGKFVESLVQALQHLNSGRYDEKPKVDDYLRSVESTSPTLDDGLRICAARIARSMYTLRNKRNIAHKGPVDPNRYDVLFLLAGAQWIIAEMLRHASGISMEEAGTLVNGVIAPVGSLVEDFGDTRELVSIGV